MNNCFICGKVIKENIFKQIYNLRFCSTCFNVWQTNVQFTLVNMPQPGREFYKEYFSASFDSKEFDYEMLLV